MYFLCRRASSIKSIFLFVHNADILLTENGTEELTKAIKSFREDQLGKKCISLHQALSRLEQS